jgi:LPXTG-motif cell wall-anchored protein
MRLRTAAIVIALALPIGLARAAPASAADGTGADLGLTVAKPAGAQIAGKAFVARLHNNGPDRATGISVTIDASEVVPRAIQFELPQGVALGPACVLRGTVIAVCTVRDLDSGADSEPFPVLTIKSVLRSGAAGSFRVTVRSASDPVAGNNGVTWAVGGVLATDPGDAEIAATSATGHVGDTVMITLTGRNNGPNDTPHTTTTVVAPTNTEIVSLPATCTATKPGREASCRGPVLAEAPPQLLTIGFKILAAPVGTDGSAAVGGDSPDANPDNNRAAITITAVVPAGEPAPPSLPRTGVRVGLIAIAGTFVVLAGIALLFLTRRRRVALVVPEDEAQTRTL